MPNFIFSVVRSGAGIFISRIFGLIRDMAIAAVYGATGLTDIFFVAFAIPNLFRNFFVEGAMSSAFMPFLAEKYKHGGKEAQNAYLSQLVILQGVIISIICAVIMVFASLVLRMFVPGYSDDPALIEVGSKILIVVMPFLLLISVSGMFSGFLNIHNNYFVSYASSALFNIFMIIGAWFGYKNSGDIMYLAYGTLFGGVAQLLVVYFLSLSYQYQFSFTLKFDSAVKKTYLLMVPSLAGVGISQLNFLVGRVLASYLPFGSISWLFYANRLFQFPLGVFSVAVGVVSLTELSKARAENNIGRRNEMITKSLISLFTIILPATIGLVGLSYEITALIYMRDAFSETDTINTSTALQMYSVGLLFFSLVNVLTRVFHADKDTKTPVRCAFFAFVTNLLLNLALMKPMGHAGIALASSVAAVLNSVLLYKNIKDYSFDYKLNKAIIYKVVLANVLMTATLLIVKYFHINVLINIAACILVYFAALFLMRVNILKILR